MATLDAHEQYLNDYTPINHQPTGKQATWIGRTSIPHLALQAFIIENKRHPVFGREAIAGGSIRVQGSSQIQMRV